MMNNIQQCEARIRGLKATQNAYIDIGIDNKPCPASIRGTLEQAISNLTRELAHYYHVLQMLKEEQIND